MEKKCTVCGKVKDWAEFYFRKGKSYPEPKCKDCARALARQWATANPDKHRERTKKWKAENPEKSRDTIKKYRFLHPDKRKAGRLVRHALSIGFLIKPTKCEGCGVEGKKLDGHHYAGYENPLTVKWLCRPCHSKAHKEAHND
jgi:hypothetical protein